ncbi:helix-turn-helix transcriptional regulator [Tistrella mobilis]|uniref:helix-turn-helix domain-containing protein n=1 Tax=Tistrella mobilis TaxID=171437 RepID=UPI00355798F0
MAARLVGQADVMLGQKIKRLRRLRGLSQSEVADVLEITFQQVQKYERGVNRIPAAAIPVLARLLNTTANHLLDADDLRRTHVADDREVIALQAALSTLPADSPARQQYLKAVAALAAAIRATGDDQQALNMVDKTGRVSVSGAGTTSSVMPQSARS